MATEKLETFAVRILERMGNWEQWAATREVNTRMEGFVKFGAAGMLAIGYLSVWFLPKAATEAAMKDRNHAKETLMQWLMCLMSIALAYLLSLLLHAEI